MTTFLLAQGSHLCILGTEDEEEIKFREDVFKEDMKKLEITKKITNQFHYLERATQTKNNDTMETSAQTDPPPMYVILGSHSQLQG